METIVSNAELEKMFDQTLREVTRQIGGIGLTQSGGTPLKGEVCAVYATFERGVRSRLCLLAEKSMFIRLTRYMMRREMVTPEDVEDFSKEYFNVVCGHIAARLFQATRVASRFGVPGFCDGRYQPEGYRAHLMLSYSGDRGEEAKLIHLSPAGRPEEDWAEAVFGPEFD